MKKHKNVKIAVKRPAAFIRILLHKRPWDGSHVFRSVNYEYRDTGIQKIFQSQISRVAHSSKIKYSAIISPMRMSAVFSISAYFTRLNNVNPIKP